MDAFRSPKVLAVSSLAVLGLYSLYRRGAVSSYRIHTPETIAREVDPKRYQEEPEYDVVIIGGGTAGCVLAARISENPNVRVLLLEAGWSSRNVKTISRPSALGENLRSPMDYDLFTEPQAHAGGTRKYWPRAKLLGGCSTMNAMMFHTCAPTDYDQWALSGPEGASEWAYKEFSKYFLKFETFHPHSKYPGVDPSLRGTNGPVNVGFFSHLHSVCAQWMESCIKLGIPFSPDVNTPVGTLGVTKIMTYVDSHGERVTMENAYLTPEVLKRPNLHVAGNSRVTRILFETKGGIKKAVGVEFASSKASSRHRVRARREIVLSAGAVHSPQILMLSGVGPKDHLAKYNIPLVHDLPGVGQKLQDHVTVSLCVKVKKGLSLMHTRAPMGLRNLQSCMAWFKWTLFGSGPLTSNLGEAAAFVRTDDPKLFPPDSYDIKDETSGPNAPDLEFIVTPINLAVNPIPPLDVVTLCAILLRPQSWGALTLKSADPFDPPEIDPRYLEKHNDVAILVRGLKFLTRIMETQPFSSSILHDDDLRVDHNLHKLTDAELESEVRKRADTIYHPTSTCRMAKLEDGGVVDAYLRVYGIENLRIADASIFPCVPSGHTTAPCIAVGEKAADMIKWSLSLSIVEIAV